jgi:hypothetical protein
MSGTNVLKRAELYLRTVRMTFSIKKLRKHKVRKVICSNYCFNICEVTEEVGISITTCYEILTENLGMPLVAAKFVLRLLIEDWKQNRVDVSKEIVDHANADEKECHHRC